MMKHIKKYETNILQKPIKTQKMVREKSSFRIRINSWLL